MPKISFSVPGVPRGKGRPRFAKRGNFVATFTDPETESYENRILMFFRQAAPGHQPIRRPVPLSVKMFAQFPIPKSFSKRRKQDCYEYLGKPDADNMVKCLDALNQVAWEDDSQIWSVSVEKIYTLQAPCLTITIEWGWHGLIRKSVSKDTLPPQKVLPEHKSSERQTPTSTLNIALTNQKPITPQKSN